MDLIFCRGLGAGRSIRGCNYRAVRVLTVLEDGVPSPDSSQGLLFTRINRVAFLQW